ncbi:protein transport protein Sec16B isoform X3 [Chelonoidis abingdonii]|uniref:protein transport protein Sec16B isoform X3 n=1 Tax=Chelonoidis abingdonii TaxID=106734 RepID=UPI0013F208C0|nr:protein transport protein Sec16B isoform X3 [Chelonoidis abingdonii]
MDPWVLPGQPQPRGRHVARMEVQDRGPWGEGYHRPRPQSRHNGERYYHHQQDLTTGPQLWPDPWMEYHAPSYPGRPGDQIRPDSRAEYYESSYLTRPYSRQGYEDACWSYPSPSSGEDSTYRGYRRPSQVLQHERDPRHEDPYGRHMNYWDQNYYRDSRHDQETSPFGQNDVAQYHSKSYSSCEERYISTLRQEQIGEESQGNCVEDASFQPYELLAPCELSRLVQYKESGLSSSSYELSQYMRDSPSQYDPDLSETWSPVQTEEVLLSIPHHVAPQKYSLPHVPVCFGAGGQLVQVCPNSPADGQPTLIEIHSLEVILHDTKEQEEMRAFPGPLVREDLHKVDVMTFCQHKVAMSCKLETERGRDSALLWKLLVLLCRQNGSMVGSDTAELLMQDCKRLEKYKRQDPAANLINLTDEEWPVQGSGTPDLLTGEIPPSMETREQRVEKFTKLLFYGRKKEALDWAMRSQLWGHALFLSSKMDLRTYSWVLSGFTSTLALNDPLQTFFQLMSGRMPQAALCCGDGRWGDWRPHLAVMLSNQVGNTELNHRAIIAMGDTLAGRGLIEAAHFCYLMANVPFGHYGVKTDHIVLLGSDPSQTFVQFARMESILQTEIFEYCQMLGRPKSFILSFQAYKLLYAGRLADYGLTSQALHYCEGIGTALLDQTHASHPVLLEQVIKLAEQLKLSDPLLLERPEQEQNLEPDWLIQLRARGQQWEEGDLPNLASAQPALSRVSGSTADRDLHHEFAQNSGYQHNLEHQQYNPPAPERTGQYQPGLQENMSSPPGAYSWVEGSEQTIASVSPDAMQENRPTEVSFGANLSLGGISNDHSPQVYQPPGSAVRLQGHSRPFGIQKNILEQQNVLNARARTVSESSAISMEEDTLRPPEGTGEGVTVQRPSTEGAEREEAKGSGFGWFSWFRSKPSKEVTPSRDVSGPAPVSAALGSQQEKDAPAPLPSPPPPATGASSSSHPPCLLPASPSPLSRSSAMNEAKGLQDPDGRESAALPGAGGQDDSHGPLSGPGGLLLAPSRGQVPLFNPAQVPQLSTAASLGLGQPKRLSQRRYPAQP